MPYWMWIGNNSTQYNATPNSNLTAAEANSIVGYTATGPTEMSPVMMNGQVLGGNFQTTFNPTYGGAVTPPGGTQMNYTSDETGEVTDARITTAVQAQFRVTDLDANGNEYLVGNYSGLFVQMNNGDLFFRPLPTTVNDWTDGVTRIYSIEVTSTTMIADNTAINSTIGFHPSIADIDIIPCFASGTLIRTVNGDAAVEDLRVGDLVLTKDHGPQPIRWIGRRKLGAHTLKAAPHLRPIRIKAGALGATTPSSDLVVSPQHRILVRSVIAQRMFGTIEVLSPAKQLLQLDGIDLATDLQEVEYLHILFDRHEIVISNGAETESLYTGAEALKSVGPAARAEIFALFPELADETTVPEAARLLASGRLARKMTVRHMENNKPLVRR